MFRITAGNRRLCEGISRREVLRVARAVFAAYPARDPVTLPDIIATVYRALGIDLEKSVEGLLSGTITTRPVVAFLVDAGDGLLYLEVSEAKLVPGQT